jgi:hypothetical protein
MARCPSSSAHCFHVDPIHFGFWDMHVSFFLSIHEVALPVFVATVEYAIRTYYNSIIISFHACCRLDADYGNVAGLQLFLAKPNRKFEHTHSAHTPKSLRRWKKSGTRVTATHKTCKKGC